MVMDLACALPSPQVAGVPSQVAAENLEVLENLSRLERVVQEELTTQLAPGSNTTNMGQLMEACAKSQNEETALLLQVFLGMFGAAWLYIDRYDLFAAAFVPTVSCCGFVCLHTVTGVAKHLHSREDQGNEGMKFIGFLMAFVICFSSFWNLSFWIWGIVQIAGHSVTNGEGCSLRH